MKKNWVIEIDLDTYEVTHVVENAYYCRGEQVREEDRCRRDYADELPALQLIDIYKAR